MPVGVSEYYLYLSSVSENWILSNTLDSYPYYLVSAKGYTRDVYGNYLLFPRRRVDLEGEFELFLQKPNPNDKFSECAHRFPIPLKNAGPRSHKGS